MFASLISKKIQIILLIGYFLVAQLFGYGNNIYKLWLIMPLILFVYLERADLKAIIFLMLMPVILLVNLLFEEQSNLEGWIFINIHLCAAIYSIIIVSNLDQKKYINEKNIAKLIILYGIFIVCSIIVERFLFISSPHLGRFLLGSQNLTSLTLLMTVPFAFLYINNKLLKYFYILIIVITVSLFIKSRGLSIILLMVIIYFLINESRIFSIKVKYTLIPLILITFAILFAYFNERFLELIYGNALHFRLLTWLRFVEATIQTNLFFGDGPSNVMVNFNKFQNLHPEIGLISKTDIFVNPHSEWVHFFSSAGIIGLLSYCLINFFLIYKFYNFSQKNNVDGFTKAVFICYLILLISAQYDITNATFTTLIIFYMTQAYLYNKLFLFKIKYINQYLVAGIFAIILSFSIYSQGKSLDLFEKGNEHSLNIAQLKPTIDSDFEKLAPHFIYVDTLKTYYYLNTAGKNFDEKTFEALIINSRKYNKYFEPSLHLSLQFYSFKRDSSEVLKILSDIVYFILIGENIITIGNDPKNIKVTLGNSNTYEINSKIHIITITPATLEAFMRNAADIGVFRDNSNLESSFSFISDNPKSIYLSKETLKKFLTKLSGFSMPLNLQNSR